jgi:hypothetical protein
VQVVTLSDHLRSVAQFEKSIDERFFSRNVQPSITILASSEPAQICLKHSNPLPEVSAKTSRLQEMVDFGFNDRHTRELSNGAMRQNSNGSVCGTASAGSQKGNVAGSRRAVLKRFAKKSVGRRPAESLGHPGVQFRGATGAEFKARRFCASEVRTRDQEKEYVLKLAQYYESLSPTQRRDLDHEMKMRTPAEFREWLKPILERLH